MFTGFDHGTTILSFKRRLLLIQISRPGALSIYPIEITLRNINSIIALTVPSFAPPHLYINSTRFGEEEMGDTPEKILLTLRAITPDRVNITSNMELFSTYP